jgi:large repetitive protein
MQQKRKRYGRVRISLFGVAALAFSLIAPAGASADPVSFTGASADGSIVFFTTTESFVPADADYGQEDVYASSGGVTTLVSTNTAGTANGFSGAVFSGASADGSKVFFTTFEKLAASDTDAQLDIYERSAGTTTQVSTNTAGTANGAFFAGFDGASADGSKVFFTTPESLAASDTDAEFDIYERSGGTTTQVSTNSAGTASGAFHGGFFRGASADGSKVFFTTYESLAASDTDAQNDVYERSAGTTTQVSTNTAGTANGATDAGFGGASADGSKVFFETGESLAASDTEAQNDVYERSAGTTTQVSTNTAGTANGATDAVFSGASAGGSKVFFTTFEKLAASDTDSRVDVYERSAGTTTQVSTNTAGTANGNIPASFSGASADGSKVFFETSESLAASDTDADCFYPGCPDVYERSAGTTTQVSTNTAGTANSFPDSIFGGASADGSKVFFETGESMAASDSDAEYFDIYERSAGTTIQVSTNTAGTANGAIDAYFSGASADGSKVFFITHEKLAASDTDSDSDIYERSGGMTTHISINPDTTPPAEPTFSGTDPASPGNNNNPKIKGSAEVGSTVQVYTDAGCTNAIGAPTAAPTFSLSGIGVTVADNSSTTFYATARDGATNTSGCSSTSITYLEDSTAPAAPIVTATDPASPANDNSPKVIGSADPNTNVQLFTDSGCTNTIGAPTAASTFASPGISVAVTDNTTTAFYAKATDTANNTSPCSTSFVSYTESTPTESTPDTAAPSTALSSAKIKRAARKATFKFSSNEPGSTFLCKIDRKPFLGCSSPKTYKKLKKGKHKFQVQAKDAAGNLDSTPAIKKFRI